MRQGLVDDLLNEWLKPKRAFRLSNSGVIGANPDQRLQADAQHLTDLSTDLGIGLLQSTLLLLLFVGVLWGLSQGEFLPVAGRDFAPPGYLVWCALLYAGAASYLSWRVGRPLIDLNAEHYAREAEFRFALVRINEHIDGITLYGGEADERRSLDGVFGSVLDISRQIVNAVTRLTVGYRRLWLVYDHSPDPGRGPGLFPRHDELRRAHGDCRRFQPGADGASMVRRQFLQPRRLARDAPARGEVPQGDHEDGRSRPGDEPHPVCRGGGPVDQDRRPSRRLARGLRRC